MFPLKTFLFSFKTSLPTAPRLFLYVTLAVFKKQHKDTRRKEYEMTVDIPLDLQGTFQLLLESRTSFWTLGQWLLKRALPTWQRLSMRSVSHKLLYLNTGSPTGNTIWVVMGPRIGL